MGIGKGELHRWRPRLTSMYRTPPKRLRVED